MRLRLHGSDSVASTLTATTMSTSSKCHLCEDTMEKQQCILSFDCTHQLCLNCAQLTEGRSVCPTCSPSDPPNYTRMYSKNTEQAPPKLSPTSKTIDVDLLSPFKVSLSRLDVPSSSSTHSSSIHSSGCCSTSSSPSSNRRPIPNGRPSSDSCIADRMDYAEDGDQAVLCQSGQQPGVPMKQMVRGPKPPYDDGQRGPVQSVRRDLVDYVRALKEHSAAFLERLDQTGINEAVFVEKIAAVEREVRHQARERRRAIDRAERELLLKLESRKEDLLLESAAARQDVELCIGQMDSLAKTIEDSLEQWDEDRLDQVVFEVQGDVRRVLERRMATVCFGSVSFIYSPENALQEDEANILGEVEFPPNKCKADDHLMFLSSPAPLVHSFDDPLYSGQEVIGLTVLADRIYAIRTRSHDIEVYQARYFSRLPALSLLHLHTPMLVPSASDLSSCPHSRTLYVADTSNCHIYRIDTTGKLQTYWKLPPNFTGLSVTDIGTVVVGSAGGRIIECDPSGRVLRTIARTPFCRKVGARRRSGVAVDTPRHFVRRAATGGTVTCDWATDGPSHVVYEVDERGQISSYFGGEPGSGEDDLNEPCCLATEPLGHVIVADRVNRRVKLLDSGLKFVRNLVDGKRLGGGGGPNRIVLDVATGRLYVGLTDGRINIYRTIF